MYTSENLSAEAETYRQWARQADRENFLSSARQRIAACYEEQRHILMARPRIPKEEYQLEEYLDYMKA